MPTLVHSVLFAASATLGEPNRAVMNSNVVAGIVKRSWGGMDARTWAPVGDTCYYPIDLELKPGVITVGRGGRGHSETARIQVEPYDYGTQEIELPDIPQANPSPADLRRASRERILLGKVFHRKEGPPEFRLPLGKPANPLPEGKSFGVNRVFNGKPAAQPHTGTDYPVPAGSPVLAAAD